MKDFSNMSKKELREECSKFGQDFDRFTEKNTMVAFLEANQNQEDTEMEELNQEVLTEEVVGTTEEAANYTLDDGTTCSRSAYIRQEFNKDRSRQDIAKELGVKYYIVYSATANMFNAAHPENGGAGATGKGSVLVAKVNAEFKFVDAEGNVVETAEEAVSVPRADLMRELAAAGVERSKMKDYFEVPYATVYAATKDLFASEGTTRVRQTVIHPETGEEVKRADYIRELYADGNGMDRRAIAKKLTEMTGDLVDYSTVWAATKPKHAEETAEAVAEDASPAEDAQ